MSTIKTFRIVVDGEEYFVEVEEVKSERVVSADSSPKAPARPIATAPKTAPSVASPPVSTPAPKAAPAVAPSGDSITAPLQGTVLSVNVSSGDQVKSGDILVVIEAMKMENEIVAPHDGEIASVHVDKGVIVSSGDLLITFK